jgi:hypothetical protein
MIMLFTYSYYFVYSAHHTGRYKKLEKEKDISRGGYLLYILSFLLGAAIYPAFRVYVRADYFDIGPKYATGLFEIKEHLAFFILLIYTAYVVIGRINFREEPQKLKLYFALATIGVISIWVLGILGFTITTLKSLAVMIP